MFRITQGHPRLHQVFVYRPFTFYGSVFHRFQLTFRIPHRSPTTPGAKPLVWADPLSLATTYGVSVDVLSSGYLDVSVRRVRFTNLCIQLAITQKSWVAPFGNLRIKVCSSLPEAYRNVLRPSSPVYAKASIKCS